MHFEILVEDQSGQKALEILVPKIVGEGNSVKIIPYKGVGRIPGNMHGSTDPGRRILLDRLPKLLQGYGKTFVHYPPDSPAAVIIVCDLDNKCLKEFRQELDQILANCKPRPEARFCIAVEEGEAWFLGDIAAIKHAYPKAKDDLLGRYTQDSICGTWEKLADAIYPGGSASLSSQGHQAIGTEKSLWAEKITPHMDVDHNASASFAYFRDKLRELAQQ